MIWWMNIILLFFANRQMPIHTDYSNFVKVNKDADADEGSGDSDENEEVSVHKMVDWMYVCIYDTYHFYTIRYLMV